VRPMPDSPAHREIGEFLDITGDVCPITFVRTRLLIEKMASGEIATVRLKGKEPLENVPASITELGHSVLALVSEQDGLDGPAAVHLLTLRKA
jgi:TusA-related sulfurtransferase